MEQQRISLADIVPGKPLQWDVMDQEGHLLLKQGQIVKNHLQIERLVAHGLFVSRNIFIATTKKTATATSAVEPISVLRIINQGAKRLERLLYNHHKETDLPTKITDIAKAIRYAITVNSEVAIATILLNQNYCNYAVRHCIDTAILTAHVSQKMGKPENDIISTTAAALTMNLGMLREQDAMQDNGHPLTDNERKIIYRHPAESVRLLREAGVSDENWLECILRHHENDDGSGYSCASRGDATLSGAKLIALADRYCARIVPRTYRKKMLPNAALRDILLNEKNKLDASLSALFLRELGIYPCGTFVKLENGEIGVVTSKGSGSTTPIVHALLGPRGAPLAFPIKRDTSGILTAIREVLHNDAASVRFNMSQLWDKDADL
jgi:HD-GYP domain-containing protein (c-di-GMP phosphodiesterase class II)